jgi:glycosyltransferase involved in cell wall biosynthesis
MSAASQHDGNATVSQQRLLTSLEAVEVAQAEPLDSRLRARRLEGPAQKALVPAHCCRVTGWILPSSGNVIAVELLAKGRLLQRAELGLPRPDVATVFPGRQEAATSGFCGEINLLPVREEARITVLAVLTDARSVPIGTLRLLRRPANPEERQLSLVSVVIPCFNQAHYLAEAIESILGQTYPELEIIVVDDGSADNSYEIAARYPGVRCVRQSHQGVAAARNHGLTESQGPFVIFLDADDRLLPHAVESGIRALTARPHIAFVAGKPRDIAGDGRVIRGGAQPLITQDHYINLLKDCFIWSGSSLIYRRSALEAVDGFNEQLTAADDYELYLKLARRFPVFCHDTVVTEYRRHGSNSTRDAALVLRSQLQVLREQRPQLRSRAESTARRAGGRSTRDKQGRALVEQTITAVRRREWRHAWRGLLTLIRSYPMGVFHLVREASGFRGAVPGLSRGGVI